MTRKTSNDASTFDPLALPMFGVMQRLAESMVRRGIMTPEQVIEAFSHPQQAEGQRGLGTHSRVLRSGKAPVCQPD